jgi:hypothetical protein
LRSPQDGQARATARLKSRLNRHVHKNHTALRTVMAFLHYEEHTTVQEKEIEKSLDPPESPPYPPRMATTPQRRAADQGPPNFKGLQEVMKLCATLDRASKMYLLAHLRESLGWDKRGRKPKAAK